MKKIIFEAEVLITEADYNTFKKDPKLVWDVKKPIMTVFERPVYLTRAYIQLTDQSLAGPFVVAEV